MTAVERDRRSVPSRTRNRRKSQLPSAHYRLGLTSTPAGNYVRAAALLYPANINPENPIGPMQSIEHALRKLDSLTENDELEIERLQKQLAEYKEQANRPFEHDAELKELLVRQAELNKALDLDKNAV